MNAAIYARVSSDKQDVDLSISAQLRALREYALKNGHNVVREFIDEAKTGRTTSRPAFRDMISLAKTKEPPFEVILVWKLNRFARNRGDSITYKALLKAKGIELISINEPFEDTPSGHLFEGIIETLDEFYSANMGQDIKRGQRENAARGYFNGSRPPYGYRKIDVNEGGKVRHKLEPEGEDLITVQTVRRIFDLASKDVGCKEIAKTLNQEGSRTKKGERWGRTTVHKVLTNEAYCGTLVWGGRPGHHAIHSGDTPIKMENAWPAIIDSDTFRLVRGKLAAKSPAVIHPRSVPSPYLLSGLLFCECGRAMIGHSAKSGRNFYYLCSRSLKQGKDACGARMLPKDKLEKLIVGQIKSRVLTDENLEELVKLVNEELYSTSSRLKDRMDAIETELKDVQGRLSRLYEVLETGKLELDDLAPRIRELRTRQDELSKSRLQLEAEMITQGVEKVNVEEIKECAEDLRSLLEEADFTERKAFLRSFVKRIEVNKKEVKIQYKLPLPDKGISEKAEEVLPIDTFGGDRGIRTPDLPDGIGTLSQLKL